MRNKDKIGRDKRKEREEKQTAQSELTKPGMRQKFTATRPQLSKPQRELYEIWPEHPGPQSDPTTLRSSSCYELLGLICC